MQVREKHLVLTDFDGTLTYHDTMLPFLKFARGIGFYRLLPFAAIKCVPYIFGVISRQESKERLLQLFLGGMTRELLETWGVEWSNELLRRRERYFRRGALEMLEERKERGERIIVVSASPEEWIRPFAKSMGIEWIATRLQYENDVFTGRINGKNCRCQEKVNRVKEYVADWRSWTIAAYGDSRGDKEMLDFAFERYWRPFGG